jgi:hypothetical protein
MWIKGMASRCESNGRKKPESTCRYRNQNIISNEAKRDEQAGDNSAHDEHQQDPGPELHRDDTGRVRVPGVHLGIHVIPHERASARGADIKNSAPHSRTLGW